VTDVLRNFVETAGPLQALVFVVAYVILSVLLVPGTISSVAAGALFGPAWGTLLALAGATIGAIAAFETARALGRERVRARLGRRTDAADRWVRSRGLLGVITLRLVPVVPFNVLNYAFGLSTVQRRNHVLGTAIGIAPGTVAFVGLGSSIADPTSAGFLGSLAAVILLVIVSTRRARSASPPPASAT
jgi:uncharacterized membrane protein YdjX (TVP38/TMEM64 family)